MFSSIGITALIGMLSHLLFIYITWRVITTINFDPLIRKGRETEARLLIIFVAIAIGTNVSRFFLDFIQWSQDLLFLF
ncbi:DUF1146 family protein [Lentibacillus juripiscarius]|uniref:DUF1146 family protein n=1 Tax=Lentibacillus juripiscarius TaxID=257446 RepID=A0ABW5V4T4_9BACI